MTRAGPRLLDEVLAAENFERAWQETRRKVRAGGIDGLGVQDFERRASQPLAGLRSAVASGRYVPLPLLHVEVPKSSSPAETRPLGLPAVQDKIVQQAVRQVVEPILEDRFLSCSYGYRSGKGAARAVRRVNHEIRRNGYSVALRRDIDDCFQSIDHESVRRALARFLPDGSLDGLFALWMSCGALLPRTEPFLSEVGIPQGMVLSPLIANVVLHELDEALSEVAAFYLRYADDVIALAGTVEVLQSANQLMERVLKGLGMRLNEDPDPYHAVATGFEFLGIRFQSARKLIGIDKRADMDRELESLVSGIGGGSIAKGFHDLNRWIEGATLYYSGLVDPDALAEVDSHLSALLARARAKAPREFLAEFDREVRRLAWLATPGRADEKRLIARVLRSSRERESVPTPLRTHKRRASALQLRQANLHVASPDAFVAKRGKRLVVRRRGAVIGSFRQSDVDQIVLAGARSNCSRAVVEWAAPEGVPITYLNWRGAVVARTEGPHSARLDLVRAQIRAVGSGWALQTARDLVRAKLCSQVNLMRYMTKYAARTRPGLLVFVGMMTRRVRELEQSVETVRSHALSESVRSRLMAIEAQGALLYCEGVRLLLNGRPPFPARVRRDAKDLPNSMLNYGYGILYARIENACARMGLDPGIPVLHAPRDGAAALTFDLIEPFRAPIVDRAVLTLLRRSTSWLVEPSGRLAEATRLAVSRQVTRRLSARTRYRSRRVRMDRVITLQCEDYARAIEDRRPMRFFIGSS